MASISGCAKVDEADLAGHLSSVIRVGDEEDTVAELIEWPRLKGSCVGYPTGSSRFREFCKAKSIIDGIWGHAVAYRGNFFRTCSVSQGGDYLYLLPDLAKEKKCRHLGDEVSLEYVQGVVKDSRTDGWAASGSEKRITAKDFLEYYVAKYVTATNGAYLCSSSARPCFFDLSSVGRVWNDNLLWVSGECLQRSDEEPVELNNRTITNGINCKVSRKEYFIDIVAREGTELEVVLKELEISRFKRVASKDDKLARVNEILDGPVDMATVSSTIVGNLAKRKAVKRGAAPHSVSSASINDSSKRRKVISLTKSQEMLEESDKITEGADLRPHFKVEADLLEEQCRAKAREKMVAIMDDEFKKDSKKSMELEIMDEEEVEEREGGLNTTEKTDANNQETINQEIENSRLRVVDLEGLLEVEKKSSAELQISLKLEEAKRQVEEKTATILSRDLALNQLTSELAELKEKAASGSRHEAELAEYRIRTLNEEISDMKCNITTLNELLLKREIDLDTTRTNLVVSEADFKKLSSIIVGKDRELHNS
ncbi:hypothetical protein GIB67_001421 [Kingdonia uniflora]|uniref:Uncharacterized protein n=1 Tax=Kingdonia uniflora TaxID=39325 RepID=A0A7J7LYW5_9MAGN|nr:hypothetical protein GIB67_001421 [Kingdonia uniflora]